MRSMRRPYLLLLLPFLWMMASCGSKQDLETDKFIRIFGTDGDDKAWDIVETDDGGFAADVGRQALNGHRDDDGVVAGHHDVDHHDL